MTIRNALRRSPWLTFGLLLAFLWILFAGTWVLNAVSLDNFGTIGQGATSGIVGLLVLAVFLGLLVVLFGELSESEPGPEQWPPVE